MAPWLAAVLTLAGALCAAGDCTGARPCGGCAASAFFVVVAGISLGTGVAAAVLP